MKPEKMEEVRYVLSIMIYFLSIAWQYQKKLYICAVNL